MNNKFLFVVLCIFSLVVSAHKAHSQTQSIKELNVKDGTVATPYNADALIDMNSINKGLHVSRVALVQTTNPLPMSAHIKGMVVYDTVTVNDVSPGLYYNDGTKWIPVKPPATTGTVTNVSSTVTGLQFSNPTTTPTLAIAGAPTAGQFLAYNGTWLTPPNTTYTISSPATGQVTLTGSNATTSNATVLAPGTNQQILMTNAAGQIVWAQPSAYYFSFDYNFSANYTLTSTNYTPPGFVSFTMPFSGIITFTSYMTLQNITGTSQTLTYNVIPVINGLPKTGFLISNYHEAGVETTSTGTFILAVNAGDVLTFRILPAVDNTLTIFTTSVQNIRGYYIQKN